MSVALASTLVISGLSGVTAVPYNILASSVAVQAPTVLKVPTLAFDEKSITLAWQKPVNYSNIVDYIIYMDGKEIGKASQNKASASQKYIKKFYNEFDPSGVKYTKIQSHTFTVTDLSPNTEYSFYVKAVDASGNLSPVSLTVNQKTTTIPTIFNVADYGAVSDGVTLNTNAIQAAIDAATPGSKVVIPEGVFKTGAIWLKSDLTFEVVKGAKLLGSENADDYQFNYYHYDYMETPRYYSLINAQSFDEGVLKNIRIVGEGIIDGNGWVWQGDKPFVVEPAEGYTDTQFPNQTVLNGSKYTGSTSDPSSTGYWAKTGILAKSQTQKAIDMGYVDSNFSPESNLQKYQVPAYSVRSNLVLMKGVENVYYGGFTAINPSNHTLVNAESKNVTVDGVRILTFDDNNADGIEFIHSDGLTVINSVFDTGDDCVNFAAGQGSAGAKNQPSQNAWIFNNYFREGHGAIVEGSHTAAWIQDILAEDNVMNHTDVGLRMKTNSRIGGGAKDIIFRDNAMRDISGQAFIFTSAYDDSNGTLEYEPASTSSEFKDVTVQNVTVDSTPVGIQVAGVSGGEHHDINFDNVKFYGVKTPTNISYMKNSTFNDVVFDGVTNPWKINYSSGLKFTGTTTRGNLPTSPDVDQRSSPVFPSESKISSVTGDTYADLSWTAATDNVHVAGYLITQNGRYINSLTSNNYNLFTGPTYKIIGLSPGLNYEYKVYAVDASGNVTDGPSATIKTTGEKDTIAPIVLPTCTINLTGGSNTTWLNINWTPAVDNFGVDHYDVYQNGEKVGSAIGSTSYNATKLKFDTNYKYEVVAVDAAGNAIQYPTSLTVKTLPAYDITAPVWKEGSKLEASDIGVDSVVLSWSGAIDDIALSGYRIYKEGKPIDNGIQFLPVNSANTTSSTFYKVTGLEQNTKYTFKVEAGDTANKWTGKGPSVIVTTKDGLAPTWEVGSKITASNIRKTDLTLNWGVAKDNVEITGYRITQDGKVISELTGTSFKVTDLTKSTAYTFKVEARDAEDNWSDALSLEITTPKDNGSGNDDKESKEKKFEK